jgi:hypothetical protein
MAGFDRLVASYLNALDLHSAYVAAIATEGAIAVGTTADPAQQLRVLARRAGADVTMLAMVWCSDARHSNALASSVRGELQAWPAPRAGWFRAPPRHAVDQLASAARATGVPVATPEAVRANAEAAVKTVSTLFGEFKATGGLKQVNQQYRAARLRLAAQGARAPSYAGWLFNYQRRLCAFIARTALTLDRSGFGRLPAELAEEFTVAFVSDDQHQPVIT